VHMVQALSTEMGLSPNKQGSTVKIRLLESTKRLTNNALLLLYKILILC